MKPFKILSHIADLRLQVFGHNYEELFQNAVFGLNSILFKDFERLKKKPPAGFEKIKVEGPDINALLVNFLNEVLTQSQINRKIYNRVKFLRLSEKSLETHIFGIPVDHFDEDVKAVTYHEVKIHPVRSRLSEPNIGAATAASGRPTSNGVKHNKRGIFEVVLVLDI
jgi:SHS2 domain-containing protein